MEAVGFIGLGTMGSRMADNLLRTGRRLVVCDSNNETARAFGDKGAEVVKNPADVAAEVTVLHLSLPDSPQVLEVALGERGIAAGARPGLVVVDHSTVAPATPERLSSIFATQKLTWLDAPVSGGPGGAKSGTLTIMVGGDKAGFEVARTSLAAIGGRIEYMGGPGTGATTKLVNNFALGIHIVAMAEALTLGVAAGIEMGRLIDIMRSSSANCWILENVIPRVVSENLLEVEPAPWFALELMHKDMRLAVAAASACDVPVAMGSLAEQVFAVARGRGWGRRDHLAIIKLYSDYVGIDEW